MVIRDRSKGVEVTEGCAWLVLNRVSEKIEEKNWQNLTICCKGKNGGQNKEICLSNHFNFSDIKVIYAKDI